MRVTPKGITSAHVLEAARARRMNLRDFGDGSVGVSLDETVTRADVAAALQERGIDLAQAQARVAALTDDEVAHVAHTLDTAPAGASDVLGTIVFIFLLLLITDILGFTKIFPFTRSIR